jgi:ParB family chromosome partitioning protein
MQIPVEDIKVKGRIRKDVGDMSALADSMKRLGQISPIMVNENNVLIAGGRRREAVKMLGWKTINAGVVDAPDKLTQLESEVEENIQRQDFNSDEIAAATKSLYKLQNPGFWRRFWNAITAFFKRLFFR